MNDAAPTSTTAATDSQGEQDGLSLDEKLKLAREFVRLQSRVATRKRLNEIEAWIIAHHHASETTDES